MIHRYRHVINIDTEWDNWAQQTYDVFKSVLMRPRFGLTLIKEDDLQKRKIAYFHYKELDSFISCTVVSGKISSFVSVIECINLDSNFSVGKFKFQTHFSKSRSPRMRQEALKLAKKISQKGIYDVMKL